MSEQSTDTFEVPAQGRFVIAGEDVTEAEYREYQQAEERRLAGKRNAEERCTHPDDWVCLTDPVATAEACWQCLLDAYFDVQLGAQGDSRD